MPVTPGPAWHLILVTTGPLHQESGLQNQWTWLNTTIWSGSISSNLKQTVWDLLPRTLLCDKSSWHHWHSNLQSSLFIVFAPIGKNHENCRNLVFLSRLTQDIQGDIRHPVDYLVDLIETKVGDKLRPGTRGRWWVGCDASALTPGWCCCVTWEIFGGRVIYTSRSYIISIYIIHIQDMLWKDSPTSTPPSWKISGPNWPASSGFCGDLRQEYKENTIDTMWLDGLIASKAITPSLGVNEARNRATGLCGANVTGFWLFN